MPSKDQEVLTGTVERFSYANGNRPAKLIVAGQDEVFELAIYPPNGVEQPWDEHSQLSVSIPTDIVGVSIQAIAEFKGYYPPKGQPNSMAQYKPSKITVLGGKAEAPKQTRSTNQPSVDENQMRIMRQSTLNYAATLVSSLNDWYDSSLHPEAIERLMVEKTISVSQKLLEYVISGEMPSFETPDDSQDLLDHEV